ncbi:MAG: MinD/ParA family protein [Hadesarchaea archaeon]|nr:MinD/ParA family protein [Hadesarchaea archaeon]
MNRGKVLAVHSYKGGTGKSVVSTNLAAIFSRKGKDVCLIDLDLRAPSLHKVFNGEGGKFRVNDFLDGRCEPGDIIFDASKMLGTPGRLLAILADPSMGAIREAISKDRGREMIALRRLISLNEYLQREMGVNYIIIDTSPGMSYSSINSVAVADLVLVLTTWDASDLSGSKEMIGELYHVLEKKATVLMNKVPAKLLTGSWRERTIKRLTKTLALPVIELIPCYCDVLAQERSTIMTLEMPEHPFSRSLFRVAEHLEKE